MIGVGRETVAQDRPRRSRHPFVPAQVHLGKPVADAEPGRLGDDQPDGPRDRIGLHQEILQRLALRPPASVDALGQIRPEAGIRTDVGQDVRHKPRRVGQEIVVGADQEPVPRKEREVALDLPSARVKDRR